MVLNEQRSGMSTAVEGTYALLRLFVVGLTAISLLASREALPLWSGAWAVLLIAGAYAGANAGLGLYQRYRRTLTPRAFVLIDLALITALIGFTGGGKSPLFLLYALPLAAIVPRHGISAGAVYMAAVTVLAVGVDLLAAMGFQNPAWMPKIGLLWALYLVLAYATQPAQDREGKAQRRDELDAMQRAAAAPMHTGDLSTVVDKILHGALGATKSCWVAIYLYDEEDHKFRMCYSLTAGDRAEALRAEPVFADESDILYSVLYANSPTSYADLQASRRLKSSILNDQPIRSAVLAPVVAPGGKKLGILCLGRHEPYRATHHQLRFAGTLALQAAQSINYAYVVEEAASLEAAKEADKLRTQLLGTVSHELRTPITAIQGFASSLRCTDVATLPRDVADDWIGEIESNAQRLCTLVTDILDLSRLESGALRMNLEWQNVNDIIEDLAPNLQVLAGTRKLIVNAGSMLPPVRCDEGRIGQVLANLVENAAKFSPPDSTIVVGAERHPEYGILLGVHDEGQGIAPEYHEKVFERFYQVEGAEYKSQNGTGLGLAICRNIVEAHGGRMWVQSAVGQGSVFLFTLPLAQSG